ncbi:MAG: Glutamyl-tRNA(Gln) amidotransferase subunit A [Candidatus Magasanikbacteria bacterium GW2011_GWC2_34_16]|uniref:Glutamyl-tRNA(Gln) amidotransferase subunit A n=2 Tax=Candidatus Magasanikiibacteriota TaxID=1752731 RepID=A0A0G0JW62_9BACT|nr:MAG: Glutamyl-tRNA(Gln) amidotransferase subunit A [Candidatus Magasanikbacteria bacterium GW2011_GWC2_34_16]KKQ41084.1 MAG: Glutamyl-tRNA(Gln) amidotransferase subunit A [Candidatus Magasanikbacteria bacterium GW2011_GWA2_37_8]
MKELNTLTIKTARAGLDKKEFTSVELTQACLNRIKERNPELNAFITVCEKEALEEARAADKIITSGKALALTGIPFAVKDAICTAGVRSTASAKILDNYTPPFNATVIQKIREQGGVLIGKNNCDAFGHGASNENSMYGAVKNPHDLTKVSGGSSGGSAVAVADHMCIFAIGEDTGGSIRQPASFCGVVGLRPSYGRNSRFGIMPMASSLDTVGPFTKTVEDMAIVMDIIAGQDSLDATTVPDTVPEYSKTLNKKSKIRIGIPKEYFAFAELNKEIKTVIEEKINSLKKQSYEIVDVSLPYTKYATAVYYIVVPSEDSSNLARMDGIRYGARKQEGNLFELYAKTRDLGFPEEVKRRILIGTYALSAGYYDAYYKKAQQVRTLIKNDFDEVFKKVDVLVTPTSPFTAFNIGEKSNDPLAMYLADVMLIPAAVSGVPAISVPGGKDKNGLPIGIQVIGPRMGEEQVLQIAKQIEDSLQKQTFIC